MYLQKLPTVTTEIEADKQRHLPVAPTRIAENSGEVRPRLQIISLENI